MEKDYSTELQTGKLRIRRPGGLSSDADCLVFMNVSRDNLGGGNTRQEYNLRVRTMKRPCGMKYISDGDTD